MTKSKTCSCGHPTYQGAYGHIAHGKRFCLVINNGALVTRESVLASLAR